MRPFAELLAEYMARTGISDSELARTLGVRRQTIFRWKEGLVEKPRYREDILRVADRLRLLPQERDELLLAAGFPPESAVGPGPKPAPEVEPDQAVVPPPRPLPKAVVAGSAALVLFIAVGLLALWRQPGASATYPVAAPGESLIVIGALGSAQAPAETPSRRLPTENAAPSNQDMSDRLRAALEREIQAARLEHVRVVVWPERIADASTPDAAESVRRRANARLVIAGTFEGSDLVVSLAIAPAASRADDLPLDALVSAPSDIPLKLSTTPEEVQMLALLALSQVYVDRGDFETARAALTVALSHSPAPPPATLLAYEGYLSQITKPPDLAQAIHFYTQTLDLAPNTATALVNRGVAYIRQDQPEWQSDLTSVVALNPDHLAAQQALCWGYGLGQQPDRALPHCDIAVRLDPTARSRDARAIAYAELGRLSDAEADWQAFLNWLGQQPESLRTRYGSSRSDWLQKDKAGQNPIDPSVLDQLRRE